MRKLFGFAAPCAAAVFAAVYLLPEGLPLPLGAVCALAAAGGLLLKGDRRLRWTLLCLGLAAGLVWTGAYARVFHAGARALADTTAAVDAVVEDWPQDARYGCSVLVRLEAEGAPGVRALLYLPDGEEVRALRPGDGLRVSARFRPADTMAGQESDYYYSRGITLIASAQGEAEVFPAGRIPPRYWPAYVSRALKDSVARAFPESAAPLVTALITGDKSGLPDGDYAALRRAGLAHVIAVSGMHVSFLSGLLTMLLGRRRRLSAGVGIALMFFFAAVAGNTPSVLRAAFMQSMLLLAPLLGREDDRPTSLSLVLVLLLAQNPYAAASVSLQLSFAAVAGIYLFTGPLYARWCGKLPKRPRGFRAGLGCKLLRFAAATLATTLGAIVFTTPLSAYYFGSVSLAAPLTNLLTLWAVSAAFLGGLAVALLGLVLPGPAGVLALPVAVPAWWILGTAGRIAKLPFASVGTDSPYLRLWLLLAYALLVLYLLWRGERKRPLVPLGLGGACLCAALLFQAASLAGGGLSVTVLDVGQGLSVALYAQGHTALVDCGGTGSNPGHVAADYVQSMGTNRLDLLVLTHYHADHANGVPALLERLEVGLLVLPDVEPEDPLRREIAALAADKGVETLYLTDDAQVSLGEAALRIYAPLGDGGANEEGLSVLASSGEFDALITGDMNATVERRLLKYGELPDIELLVAGHHGSKYATSEELLLATAPEYAALSVGYNTYGHPAPETLERLAAAGCAIYRTDWMGTVRFTARGER